MKGLLVLCLIFAIFLVGCGQDDVVTSSSSTPADGFIFERDLKFCIKSSTENIYAEALVFDSMAECEEAMQVKPVTIDGVKFCNEQAAKIDPLYPSHEALQKKFVNRCYFDFALASRNINYCATINDDFYELKDECFRELISIVA